MPTILRPPPPPRILLLHLPLLKRRPLLHIQQREVQVMISKIATSAIIFNLALAYHRKDMKLRRQLEEEVQKQQKRGTQMQKKEEEEEARTDDVFDYNNDEPKHVVLVDGIIEDDDETIIISSTEKERTLRLVASSSTATSSSRAASTTTTTSSHYNHYYTHLAQQLYHKVLQYLNDTKQSTLIQQQIPIASILRLACCNNLLELSLVGSFIHIICYIIVFFASR